MAYSDYSAKFSYKMLATYQDQNQHGANAEYFKSGAAAPTGNWVPTGAWTYTPGSAIIPITIDQNSDAKSLLIDSEGTGSFGAVEIYAKQGLYIKQDISNGWGLWIERNIAEAGANPLVTLYTPNTSDLQPTLKILTAGINYGINVTATGSTLGSGYFESANLVHAVYVYNSYKTSGLGAGVYNRVGTDDNSSTNTHETFADGSGDAVGSITSSGGTVAYNAFTGGHPSIERHDMEHPFGYLMIRTEVFHDVGFAKIHPAVQSHQSEYIIEPSTKKYDKRVFGAYAGRFDKEKHQMYAVGDGYILVCNEGGNIENGDYLASSSREGHAMKQDDDILHGYTVAKASEDVDWSKESGKTRLVACTYHAG